MMYSLPWRWYHGIAVSALIAVAAVVISIPAGPAFDPARMHLERSPITFERNLDQFHEQVDFLVNGVEAPLSLAADGLATVSEEQEQARPPRLVGG